jgi:hypothetical protein
MLIDRRRLGVGVAIPQISLIYIYPVRGHHVFGLASASIYSAHADFFNAADEHTLTALVDSCLNGLRHCGRGSWPDAARAGWGTGAAPGGRPPPSRAAAGRARCTADPGGRPR